MLVSKSKTDPSRDIRIINNFEPLVMNCLIFFLRSRYSGADFGRESYLPWREDNRHWEWKWDSERREIKNGDWKRGSTAADSGMHYITQAHEFFFPRILLHVHVQIHVHDHIS